MTIPKCAWIASDKPRGVVGEHYDDCAGDGCRGCWPCLHGHCSACRIRHTDNAHPVTCPKCVGDVREDLDQIAELAARMLGEAIHKGVDSEAAMLAGPSANAVDWQRRQRLIVNAALTADEDSDEAKRLRAWISDCRDEAHPLWILGTWSEAWRDHLDQPDDRTITIERAYAYLSEHLTRMAQVDEPDFGQFVTEVRGCRSHMQAVIHDENQGDRANVGCFDCGDTLERRLTTAGFEDHWTCRRCRRRYTYAEYNFALRAALEQDREAS